jgi:hypothetical protein
LVLSVLFHSSCFGVKTQNQSSLPCSPGVPGGIRTHDLQLRRLTLYPLSYEHLVDLMAAPLSLRFDEKEMNFNTGCIQ